MDTPAESEPIAEQRLGTVRIAADGLVSTGVLLRLLSLGVGALVALGTVFATLSVLSLAASGPVTGGLLLLALMAAVASTPAILKCVLGAVSARA